MKTIAILFFTFFSFSLVFAQKSREEKALEALIQAGIVRKQGDVYIFKVKNEREMSTYKMLYSGLVDKPYSRIKFEYANETKNSTKNPNQNSNQNSNNTPINPNPGNLNTTGMANVDPSQISQFEQPKCCFCNIKTFGFSGAVGSANAKSEHSFKVPQGVFKIKIEAWSAGGNGWIDFGSEARNDRNANDLTYFIIGGGGGSGAYYEGVINVMPGNTITLTIPGGGSSAQLQLRMENRGILKMSNGKTATEGKRAKSFNADGGRIEMISGIFEENYYSLRGTPGSEGWIGAYVDRDFNRNVNEDGIGAPQLPLPDGYDIYGGNGGNAPKSSDGGNGYIYSKGDPIHAKDGGFPGGGGGGKDTMYEGTEYDRTGGNGASGYVILHY